MTTRGRPNVHEPRSISLGLSLRLSEARALRDIARRWGCSRQQVLYRLLATYLEQRAKDEEVSDG